MHRLDLVDGGLYNAQITPDTNKPYGIYFTETEDGATKLITHEQHSSGTDYIKRYSTDYTSGPPILTEANLSSAISIEDGFIVEFLCKQDCIAQFNIANYEKTEVYSYDVGTFSGSTETQIIEL